MAEQVVNDTKSEINDITNQSGSGDDIDDDEEEEDLLQEGELERLQNFFVKVDRKKTGFINVEEAMFLFKKVKNDYNFSEEEMFQILNDSKVESTYKMSFEHILKVVEHIRKEENEEKDKDTLLAYVAVGGEDNKGGCVTKETLIEIIRDKFEMTINIEKLIDEIDEDGSGEIEWGEFRSLMK